MERQHQSKTKNSIAPPQTQIARHSTHPIEELQGAIGNRSVNQLLANQPRPQPKPMFGGLSGELRSPIQAKLAIGTVGDKYEQEADRFAEQVVSQINAPENSKIQRKQMPEEDEKLQMKPEIGRIQWEKMPEEDEDEKLQMKPVVATDGMAATPNLEASINQSRGSGQRLADNIRHPMEKALGADFSGVRVHTDSQSHQFNQSIQAKAFTTGQDIFFSQGEYQPGSQSGKELLAHELTHVVQQRGTEMIQRVTEVEFDGATDKWKEWISPKMKQWLFKHRIITAIRNWKNWAKTVKIEIALALVDAYISNSQSPRTIAGVEDIAEEKRVNLSNEKHAVQEAIQANERLDEDWLFVGYLGTSTVFEESIMQGINPPRVGTRGIKGEQLGYGLYIADDVKVAEEYALEQYTNQEEKNKSRSPKLHNQPLVLRIYAKNLETMKGKTSIPSHEWWDKNLPQAYLTDYNYLESTISGDEKEGGHQIKFNENVFRSLKAERGYTLDPQATAKSKKELHEDIIRNQMSGKEPQEHPQAILMMGGPGAGKSTLVDSLRLNKDDYVLAGPDEVKERLPEYKQGIERSDKNIAPKVHSESRQVSVDLLTQTRNQRLNLLYDGTGADSSEYLGMIEKLHEQGYKVQLLMPYVQVSDALQRVRARAEQTGRGVPEEKVRGIYGTIEVNFQRIAAQVDEASLYDNRGTKPVLVWQKSLGEVADLPKVWQRLKESSPLLEVRTQEGKTANPPLLGKPAAKPAKRWNQVGYGRFVLVEAATGNSTPKTLGESSTPVNTDLGEPSLGLASGSQQSKQEALEKIPAGNGYNLTPNQAQLLAINGLENSPIAPDGDCLFNSVIAVGAFTGNVQDLRNLVADKVSLGRIDLRGFPLDPARTARDIRQLGSYNNLAGDATPSMIANALGITIIIYNENSSTTTLNGGPNGPYHIIRFTRPAPHYHATMARRG